MLLERRDRVIGDGEALLLRQSLLKAPNDLAGTYQA
jgi:hypothetical protein